MRYLGAFLFLIGIVCLFHDVPRAQVPLTGAGQGAHFVASGGGTTTAFDTAGSGQNSGGSVTCHGALASCSAAGNGVTGTYTPVGTPTCIAIFLQNNQGNVTSVNYGAATVTSAGTPVAIPTHPAIFANAFYAASPPSGAQTVSYVLTGGGFSAFSIMSFTQTGTHCFLAGSYGSATTTGGTSISNPVSSESNDLVVDFVAVDASTPTPTGTGQVQRDSGGQLNISTTTGAATATPTWTSASQNMADVAFSVQHN